MTNFVYLVSCQGYFKIGEANDITTRVRELQTGNPFPISVVAHFPFEDSRIVEKTLHQKFKNKRHRGEWFSLDQGDIADFIKICKLLSGEQGHKVSKRSVKEEFTKIGDATEKILPKLNRPWRIELQLMGRYFQWRTGSREKRRCRYGGKLRKIEPSPELKIQPISDD